MSKHLALVDVNSFFASCEKLFHPELANRPVVVLSNNDGMVIARCAEAKALGIAMGAPWFTLAAQAPAWGLVARSSNYELYGDLSARVMQLLGRFSADQEIYSIDESFLTVPPAIINRTAWGTTVKEAVQRNVGLPVCVGIATSKTLAKLANHGAKKHAHLNGVCDLSTFAPERIDRILAGTPVNEIWGVAGRLAKRLAGVSIHSALDLREADPVRIRKTFSVTLGRTVLELRGISCMPLEEERATKEQLIHSRSFAAPISTVAEIEQVLAVYTQQVGARLRAQGSVTRRLTVWAGTSPYSQQAQHAPTVTLTLQTPSDDPSLLLSAAKGGFLPQVIAGMQYVRVGVVLSELSPKHAHAHLSLFETVTEHRDLGALVDAITDKIGTAAVGFGLAGLKQPPAWSMKRELLSPRATTHWDELVSVHAR